MKITGAIFDMDGTLVDSLGFWDILWAALGEKYNNDKSFRPDPITEKAVRTLPLYDAMCLVHKSCGLGESGDEVFRTTDQMLKDFYAETVELKPGALEFLEHLKSRGVKMCVASATAPHLINVLMEKFGLSRFFPRIISCSDVGKGKEHPDVFIFAHDFLGTEKETTWIFEDSIVALETATKAGYKTVGIYDKYNFGIDRVKEISTVYIGEDDILSRLIPEI